MSERGFFAFFTKTIRQTKIERVGGILRERERERERERKREREREREIESGRKE